MRRPKQKQPVPSKRHIFSKRAFILFKSPCSTNSKPDAGFAAAAFCKQRLGNRKKRLAPPRLPENCIQGSGITAPGFIGCGRRGALFRGVTKDARQIRKGSVFACAPGLQKMDAGLEKWHSLLCRRKARPFKGAIPLRQMRERSGRDTRCGIPPADEHAAAQYAPMASRPPPLN